jgi:hypothetical protein
MKKIIYFSVLLCLITSCNLEDFNEPALPIDNPLLLKKTTIEGPDLSRETSFDDKGRFIESKNNNSGSFEKISYKENIDEINVYSYGRIEITSYRLNYNNSELTSFNSGFMGSREDFMITKNGNLASFNYEIGNESYTYTVVFETNQFSKVIGYYTFNNSQNKYSNKRNLFYDYAGNLIEVVHEIADYEAVNLSIKFTYDERTNPQYISMAKYIPALLMIGNGYQIIIDSSPNNLTSNSNYYENYFYKYQKNQPVSSEKTIKEDTVIRETKTYFYH